MESTSKITRDELVARLAEKNPPLVIDVLPEEEFRAVHLAAARNACVYNVTFLDDVKKLAPDSSKPLVVYGSSERSLASATAAEKLIGAGYADVADYRGGLEDWRDAGMPVEGDPSVVKSQAELREGTHPIDIGKSRIEWTGRNLMSAHSGTIRLCEGGIEIAQGLPVSGSFTVDMNTITNADIEDAELRQLLIDHLKSDDFFDVQRFPDAKFQLSRVVMLSDARPGNPNCEVSGELTMKGISREVAFRAVLGQTVEGLLAADAHFDIDRTQWNVLYGSGKFYEKLGKHLVHDEISLALKLVTLPLGSTMA